MTDITRIFSEIFDERQRQDKKFGPQDHKPMIWIPILVEEVGEVAKAALETHFQYSGADTDYSRYRKELIQVAAVAVAMVQNIDAKQKQDEKNIH